MDIEPLDASFGAILRDIALADLNEESANLLALQTREQLGINSLSLAAQSERSILALFG